MVIKITRLKAFMFIGALATSCVMVPTLSLSALAQNTQMNKQYLPMDHQQNSMSGEITNRIAWSQMVVGLESQGYIIREIETDRDGWKAEVFDRNGARFKLYLNGQGSVVRKEYD